MKIAWLGVFFLVAAAHGGFEHLLKDLDMPMILARCVTAAAKNFFRMGQVIMFMLPQNGIDPFAKSFLPFNRILLGELYATKNWSIMVSSPKLVRFKRRSEGVVGGKPDKFIMMVNSAKDISDCLQYLEMQRMLNAFADFIIINTQSREEIMGNIQSVLSELWSYNILSGVILFPNTNTSEAFDVYTWDPFAGGKCGEDVEEVIRIGVCNSSVLHTQRWFPLKIPENLNGCPVKVRTIISPPFVMEYTRKVEGTEDEYVFESGIDIQMLNLVAEIANFTVQYSMSGKSDDYGGKFKMNFTNGTRNNTQPFMADMNETSFSAIRSKFWSMNGINASTGILDMVRTKRVDIGLGAMSISLNAAELEVSFPYSQDALIYCVPHSQEVPHWKKLSNIVYEGVWVTTAVTIILTFILVRTSARRAKEEKAFYKRSIDVACALLQSITANIITIQPATTKVRVSLMLWIIFSLYFDTAYQTSLMSTLTKVNYQPQIKTQDEILRSNLDVLFLESSMQYFNTWPSAGEETPEQAALKSRWKVCHDLHDCLNQTARVRNSTIATSKAFIDYEIGDFYSKSGQPLLYCFKDNILTLPIAMYMRTGYPLKEKINKLIYAIDASGYVDFWFKNINSKNRIVDYQADVHLTAEHFMAILIISIIGHVNATIIFVLELLVYKYRQKPENEQHELIELDDSLRNSRHASILINFTGDEENAFGKNVLKRKPPNFKLHKH